MALFFVNFRDIPLLALVVRPVGTINWKNRKKHAFFPSRYKEKQRVFFKRYRYWRYENISKQILQNLALALKTYKTDSKGSRKSLDFAKGWSSASSSLMLITCKSMYVDINDLVNNNIGNLGIKLEQFKQ